MGRATLLIAMNFDEDANSSILVMPMVHLTAPVNMRKVTFASDDAVLAAPKALLVGPKAQHLRYCLLTHAHAEHNSDFVSF